MKIVLVTGANGFIGRHCLPLLIAKGYEVHAASSRIASNKIDNIYWHHVDLLDLKQTSNLIAEIKPSHLLHLAWYAVPQKYWTSIENLNWVQASLNLLQSFSMNRGQRVVIAGTCAEYDWRYGYCSEQITPFSPATLYGICKYSLQKILDIFAKQFGLSAAWGLIFFLYGPYEHSDRLVPSVILSLLKDHPARCTHGNQIRDLLYVEDVADAFVELLGSDVSGAINIASGCPITLRDIIYKIAEKLDRRDLIQLGALPVSEHEPHLILADVSRLTNELGWLPKYNLEKGLDQTIDWWKNHILHT